MTTDEWEKEPLSEGDFRRFWPEGIPATVSLYPGLVKAVDVWSQRLVASLPAELLPRYERVVNAFPNIASIIFFDDKQSFAGNIFEADAVSVESIANPDKDEANPEKAIHLFMNLYQDGSPYISEADLSVVEALGKTGSHYVSSHILCAFPERPPVLTPETIYRYAEHAVRQEWRAGKIVVPGHISAALVFQTIEQMKLPFHVLSDEEAQTVIDLLKANLKVDNEEFIDKIIETEETLAENTDEA